MPTLNAMTTLCPPLITALDALFENALIAMDTARSSKRALDRELRELTAYEYDDLQWDPDTRDLVEKEVRNFAQIVVRSATQQLSSRGARLDIRADEYLASFRDAERVIRECRRNDYDTTVEQMMAEIEAAWRVFRPSALWAQIATRYSPAAVAAHASGRAAHCLVNTFDLTRRPSPRVVKGRVEMEMSVRAERQRGGLSLRYESQRLQLLGEAFETFAVASFPEDTTGLARAGHVLSRCTEVALRDRLDLGAGVEAVVYLSAIKLYLPAHVAEALNQFVTLHAASAFSRRSAA